MLVFVDDRTYSFLSETFNIHRDSEGIPAFTRLMTEARGTGEYFIAALFFVKARRRDGLAVRGLLLVCTYSTY